MMWNDIRVDLWWYLILLTALTATILFFTKSNRYKPLYWLIAVSAICWIGYEASIAKYLSSSVPIRLDFPIVLGFVLFPIIPIYFHRKRMIKLRNKNNLKNEP